jgi:hypothetical protein
MIRRYIALGLMLLLSSGCAIRVADFSVVSVNKQSNIPAKSIGKRVSGENCVFSFLGIDWLSKDPNLKDAIDQAMQSAGPDYDAMVDTTVHRKTGLWSSCYIVKGTVISTKK